MIYNEALVQNLDVGTKENNKEFRTACLWAKNRKVSLVITKLQCTCWVTRNSRMWKAAYQEWPIRQTNVHTEF